MKRMMMTLIAPVLGAAIVLGGMGTITASQVTAAKNTRTAQSTVLAYFGVLNSGMASSNFSGLPSVFAADAVLTKSNTDGTTTVYHGLSEITSFYQALHQKLSGWQWTTDDEHSLGKGIIIAYEHAGSPPLTVASRCVHVFVIKHGKIASYDWAAFYPGQK